MMKFAAAQGNVQIAYDVLGTGAPVLMLHDFGQSSGFWYKSGYVQTCLAQGRQVVLVDLRGHGDSSEPADSTAYGPVTCSQDVMAVLDHAGIRRADVLGYGVGGRIALCLAARAPDRVHAVAAGAAHPFAERAQRCRDALAKGLEPWGKLIETDVGMTIAGRRRLTSNDPATLSVAGSCDWSDIAEAVARSGVPVLLFVRREDPRYPLVLSFAEQSGAKVIVLAEYDCATTAPAAGSAEILSRILAFFEAPRGSAPAEQLPPCMWSGSWP